MEPRLNAPAAAPEAYKAMLALEAYVKSCGLEPSLIGLLKMRVSQINGCAYCLDMHSKEAREHGETEQRLYLLNAWHESPLYSARERAALGWAEALTLVAQTGAPDADYDKLRQQFSESEQVKLTLLVGVTNVWNRLAIGFRAVHPIGAVAHAKAS